MAKSSTMFGRRGRGDEAAEIQQHEDAETQDNRETEAGEGEADQGAQDGIATAPSMTLHEQLHGTSPVEDANGKKPKKSDEQKAADWSRLGSSRGTDAIRAMMLLGHLANPTQYKWTEEQETALCDALAAKVAELRKLFAVARTPQEGKKRPKQLLMRV